MSDLLELIILIILFLIIFGSPFVVLTIFMVQRRRRRHNLSIVIQEKLIHVDRKELSNEEKKVFRRQTHDIIWFLILSLAILIMFAMLSDFKWNESEFSRTSTYTLIILYVAIETGVVLGSLRNVRHLLPWCRNYLTKGYVAHVYNIEGSERSFEIAFYDIKRDKIVSRNKSIMNLDIQWQFNYKNMIPQQMIQYKSLSPTEILTPRETARRIQNGIGEILEKEGKFPKEGELIDIVIREKGRRSVLVCIPLDQHFGEDKNEPERKFSQKKTTDSEVEILTGTFPHGGVRLIHQYYDEEGNITRKSKAKLVRSAEYSTDGKILFQEEKKLY